MVHGDLYCWGKRSTSARTACRPRGPFGVEGGEHSFRTRACQGADDAASAEPTMVVATARKLPHRNGRLIKGDDTCSSFTRDNADFVSISARHTHEPSSSRRFAASI